MRDVERQQDAALTRDPVVAGLGRLGALPRRPIPAGRSRVRWFQARLRREAPLAGELATRGLADAARFANGLDRTMRTASCALRRGQTGLQERGAIRRYALDREKRRVRPRSGSNTGTCGGAATCPRADRGGQPTRRGGDVVGLGRADDVAGRGGTARTSTPQLERLPTPSLRVGASRERAVAGGAGIVRRCSTTRRQLRADSFPRCSQASRG